MERLVRALAARLAGTAALLIIGAMAVTGCGTTASSGTTTHAAGKTHAARMFVSLRTVESNLSRIYHKLGLRSRTELARSYPAGSSDTLDLARGPGRG